MVKLQIKYCYSEEELNNFLLGLNLDTRYTNQNDIVFADCPRLQGIQYLPKVKGDAHEYYNEDGEKMCKAEAGCDIVAIVSYFVEVPLVENNL